MDGFYPVRAIPFFFGALWKNGAAGMVDDADFEFAVWTGGRDVVLLDEGCEHAALDEVFTGRDVADPWPAATVCGCAFDGAGEGIFIAGVGGCDLRNVIAPAAYFVGHGLFADATAFRARKRTAVGEDAFPACHLGLPDIVGDVGEVFPVEFEDGIFGHAGIAPRGLTGKL